MAEAILELRRSLWSRFTNNIGKFLIKIFEEVKKNTIFVPNRRRLPLVLLY